MSDNNIQELTKKIYNSRLRIYKNNPFFGVFLSTFKFGIDTTLKTFSTDGTSIYYNEDFLRTITEFEIDLTILHALMHVVLQHPYRYNEAYDNELFHLACDIVVNSNIMSSLNRTDDLYIQGRMLKHKCPNGDEGYLHTVEEVYKMLVKVYNKIQNNNQNKQNNKSKDVDDVQFDDNMPVNQKTTDKIALKIKASYDGDLYLREISFGDYEFGKGWYTDPNIYPNVTSINPLCFVSDKLEGMFLPKENVEVKYLIDNWLVGTPWYADSITAKSLLADDKMSVKKNTNQKVYINDCYPFYIDRQPLLKTLINTPFSDKQITKEEQQYSKYVYKHYLDVPPVIKTYMLNFIQKGGINPNDPDMVIKLRNMIATTFKYDAKHKKCPSNKDPVLYFMDEEKKGVCVEFATSFVLLLRSIGIPARYVTGFRTEVTKDEVVDVENIGHAWVEYYLDKTGWITIDPTPVILNIQGGSGDGKGKNDSDSNDDKSKDGKNGKEDKESDNNGLGKPIDESKKWEKNKDEKENEMKRDEINQKILQAYDNLKCNGFGDVPNSLEILVQKLKTPLIDWRVLLYDFIEENIVDYSFCPPDTRFSEADFVLPGFNVLDENIKKIYFMVDVSGSMSLDDIENCFSEIQGALSQFNGKISGVIGFFDTQIHETYPIDEDTDLLSIIPHGWGGTSFQAVFDYIDDLEEEPNSIIILSDGDCEYPSEKAANGIPVLWIINNEKITPPWGKTIRLIRGDDEDA